jgi:hypothetical protein
MRKGFILVRSKGREAPLRKLGRISQELLLLQISLSELAFTTQESLASAASYGRK